MPVDVAVNVEVDVLVEVLVDVLVLVDVPVPVEVADRVADAVEVLVEVLVDVAVNVAVAVLVATFRSLVPKGNSASSRPAMLEPDWVLLTAIWATPQVAAMESSRMIIDEELSDPVSATGPCGMLDTAEPEK